LQLTRSFLQLRDAELKTLEYLTSRYRRVVEAYALIPPLRARREELQMFVYRARIRIEIGQFTSTEYFNYLQVQRDLADAVSQEFRAIAVYNTAIAEFEFAKGTIQRYNNITMAEGPLPPWVHKRAKDNECERTEKALKLRERPAHDPAHQSPPHPLGPGVGSPTLPPLTDLPPHPDLPPPRPVDPKNGMPGLPGMPPKVPGVNPPLAGGGPAPLPLPGPGPGVRVPQPLPHAVPPVVVPELEPDPDSFFRPSGTVDVPRFKPLRPPVPKAPAPLQPPAPVPPTPGATPPASPPGGSSGIPASLPSSTGIADIPTVPPLTGAVRYPSN
jgi:hypothetical protein